MASRHRFASSVKRMIVVSNTTPLIGLAVVGQFELQLSEMKQNKVGTVGLLLKGKQVGFLSETRPYLEALREQGFSLSQTVIESALQ